MDKPLVSVIITVYNGEKYLAEAINSVLVQTYNLFEIIVVDDGSTDNSGKIVKSYDEVKYIYQTNKGNAVAKNNGVRASNGSLIAFIDADDLWDKNKLSVQVNHLINNHDIGYVICNMRNFLESHNGRVKLKKTERLEEMPSYIPSAFLIRRDIFDKVGGFETSYVHAADTDWHFRAKDLSIPMSNVSQLLLHRRLHDSNLSKDRVKGTLNSLEMFQVVKASIARKAKIEREK